MRQCFREGHALYWKKKKKRVNLNTHADVSSRTRDLNFDQSLYLHPNFVNVSREGPVKSNICAGLPESSMLQNVIIPKTKPGSIGQLLASLPADPGVMSSIPAWSHTFVEVDLEIIFTVVLLLPLIQ